MQTNRVTRRGVLTGLGATGASVLLAPAVQARLPEDKITVVHYYSNAGDANGRRGQPMVNQSTNVVMSETESGLIGVGEGGEPTSMDEYASMLINSRPDGSFTNW
jgi:hypothetical protein